MTPDSTALRDSPLCNPDLAPVPPEHRTWTVWNIAALWVGLSVCIPTYMMAAGLVAQGMSIGQSMLTIALGNLIVLIPMVLNAHAGTRYGIPFPVLLRASFGTLGANVPAMMRALVACGWFGIQTWIGGAAIYTLHVVIFGFSAAEVGSGPWLGLTLGHWSCFLLFWLVNMAIILMGIDSIKWLENLAAPFLLISGLALLVWAVRTAGGPAALFDPQVIQQIRGQEVQEFDFWRVFGPNLTAMVGFWATLSLNIPDFTRYARSQRDQMLGQLIGLPSTMALFSFIGIAVTCASVLIYGQAIWQPVDLVGRFGNPVLVGVALLALTVATLSTNIAANIVSPANDFSNLWPRRISFKLGGLIAGVIGIGILPWKLIADPSGYIFTWLIGYGGLLGAIAGVMIVDYFLIRRGHLNVDELYQVTGRYRYQAGFNWRALVALALGISVNVPGFIVQVVGRESLQIPEVLNVIYTYAWFAGLLVAGVAHATLSTLFPAVSHQATLRGT
ncbi:MAG: NCS1 family nucleobase:cation symporter-1 [Pirellulaceae bacterium]|nr:NCS1 family nucleobase:cation symporter-1 [Pirellulaceae bacterium]